MFHLKGSDHLGSASAASIEEVRSTIRRAFQNAVNNKQLMNKTEFKMAWIYLFGYKISKYELQEYFDKLQKNYYEDMVNYEQFERKVMSEVRRLDNIEELRNAFMTIDFSCKGFLTLDDLNKQFQLVAPHLSQKTIDDTFRELDRDGDGRISYKDFELAMEYTDD